LLDLEEGIHVLGSEIEIKKTSERRKVYYKSTVHPIFLPLNLTEVYAMTTYLDQTLNKADPNAKIVLQISERIPST